MGTAQADPRAGLHPGAAGPVLFTPGPRHRSELHGSIVKRGSRWYLSYKAVDGRWLQRAADTGDEAEARKVLADVEETAQVQRDAGVSGPLNVRQYAKTWIARREELFAKDGQQHRELEGERRTIRSCRAHRARARVVRRAHTPKTGGVLSIRIRTGKWVEARGVELCRDANQTERLLHIQELASWVIRPPPP
jgi:hypothetical protein